MSKASISQDVSYKAIKNLSGSEQDKISFMIENMHINKAFLYCTKDKSNKEQEKILTELKKTYLNYRSGWRKQPQSCFSKKLFGDDFKKLELSPLCIDLELASVCDLACPHCFRQTVATPDKIMSKKLAFKLIDQAAELKVPSMKFNWRGEPLLNPSIYEIIDYAKSRGILETIINTNATELDEEASKKIINSGLDIMIYSFDGGTKSSYEKMRPGRFKENTFNKVIKNIRKFSEVKNKLNAKFPRTKIQMVLTKDTRNEQNKFFELFKDTVDDVSVKQYSERGGKLKDIDEKIKTKTIQKLKNKQIENAEVLFDIDNTIFISQERLPCEQPFQRLQITYDGKVSMCCYDWGSSHSVGYVDELAINTGNSDLKKVFDKAKAGAKGFELMNLKKVENFNKPEQVVSSIKDIWHNSHINKVREKHVEGKIEDVEICKNCSFKDTYKWEKI